MSYDLSFEKKQLWILGALAVLMGLLLLAGGFFAGQLVSGNGAAAVDPAADASATSGKKKNDSAKQDTASANDLSGADLKAEERTPNDSIKPKSASPASAVAGATSADFTSAAAKSAPKVLRLASGYTLQFGVFRETENAKTLAKELGEKGTKAQVVTLINGSGEALSAVRFGQYATAADAVSAAHGLEKTLNAEIMVRPVNRL